MEKSVNITRDDRANYYIGLGLDPDVALQDALIDESFINECKEQATRMAIMDSLDECDQCGHPQDAGAPFCMECGHQLGEV